MFKSKAAYWAFLGLTASLLSFPLSMPASFRMDETRDPLFEKIPVTLGEWIGKDSELDKRTYEILETRNVLSRLYETPGGKKVHLLLVGSHKDRRVAHPPEVCYVSSHFSIVESGVRDVNLETSRSRGVSPRIDRDVTPAKAGVQNLWIPASAGMTPGQDSAEGQSLWGAPPTRVGRLTVKEFVAKDVRSKGASEHVLYVYKIGERFTTNYYTQQILFAWDKLTRKNSQVLLIRLAGPDKAVFDSFLPKILALL
ncbi:MAG: exosortase-associated EpsI family protein [Candidatus Omnitrophica bacterium]|nr:exosortase-associated EpsI family protein [Candidatus Omnitrophota bacterium]